MDCQHAFITGGSRGLGLSVAKTLAKRGVHITLVDVLDCTEAAKQVNEAGQGAVKVQWYQGDVTNATQMEQLGKEAEMQLGPVDLLVANAGISGSLRPIVESPSDQFAQVLAVNVMGVVNTVKAVLPAMLERRRGHILLVASLSGSIATVCMSPYVSSKFAVRGFADVLRLETLGTGVSVHVAMPSFINTPMMEDAFTRPDVDQDFVQKVIKIVGSPMDADEVTAGWVRGMERGDYIIRSPYLVNNLANHLMAGMTAPGLLWWPLDILLAPVLSILRHIMRAANQWYLRLPQQLPAPPPAQSGKDTHEE